MQNCIIIEYKKDGEIKVDNRIFDSIRALNKCFNDVNNLNCKKEVWVDEAYISFTFKAFLLGQN